MVDYQFYKETYGGSSIPETAFPRFERKATNKLDRFTFGRIVDEIIDENIKFCVCDIADTIYNSNDREGKASESTDGYSVTYNESLEGQIYRVARDYLANTGLLYLGVYAT